MNLSGVYYNFGLIDDQGLAIVKDTQDAYDKAIKTNDNEKAREVMN